MEPTNSVRKIQVQHKFAFIGFGKVAQTFARILEERREQLAREYSLEWETLAVATGRHGCVISDQDINLTDAIRTVSEGANLSELPGVRTLSDPFQIIERCDANIFFETSPLSPVNGQPAIDYIRSALARRINVISANKGPVAYAYNELRELAGQFRVHYKFEGSVMDGAPVFNLVQNCLPGVRVLGFEGVLNSTSNLILTLMEGGSSFEDALREAQQIGIAEFNPDYDIDGWDALLKARALSNVLMASEPVETKREGIRDISRKEIEAACRDNCSIRPIVRASQSPTGLRIEVLPERVPFDSALATARGTSNVLVLKTDLMGDLAIFETDPGLTQTAYALLSDLLSIHLTSFVPPCNGK